MSRKLFTLCEMCAKDLNKFNFLVPSTLLKQNRQPLLQCQQKHWSHSKSFNSILAHNSPCAFSVRDNQLYCNSVKQTDVLCITKRGYKLSWLNGDNGMSKAVSEAEKIVGYPTSFLNLRCLFSDELSTIAYHIRKLVGTKHPLLKTARGLIFDGKDNIQMRGLLVMLIAKAAGPNPGAEIAGQEMVSGVYQSQRSLAEITEVIHTANLIHKGVVNLAETTPEDGPLADMEFGNKMAVLSGDYLLASACTGLAKLENPTVLEKIATSIGDMMTADFTNFSDASGRPVMPQTCQGFSDWLQQTYLSFGSLVARSCQSAMILAGHPASVQSMAYSYGENITYAQQLCLDLLPFLKREELSGLSLTSAPVFLFKEKASEEEFTKLQTLMEQGPGGYPEVVTMVTASGVITQCKDLLQEYRDKAIASLDCYGDSDAKKALVRMATVVSDYR